MFQLHLQKLLWISFLVTTQMICQRKVRFWKKLMKEIKLEKKRWRLKKMKKKQRYLKHRVKHFSFFSFIPVFSLAKAFFSNDVIQNVYNSIGVEAHDECENTSDVEGRRTSYTVPIRSFRWANIFNFTQCRRHKCCSLIKRFAQHPKMVKDFSHFSIQPWQ